MNTIVIHMHKEEISKLAVTLESKTLQPKIVTELQRNFNYGIIMSYCMDFLFILY